jgi:hypothetical protein
VFDRDGFEKEVQYHLKDIKMRPCTKGKLDTSLLTVPLPDLVITWRQNKQGKDQAASFAQQPRRFSTEGLHYLPS